MWSNETIDEAGEYYDFKITGKGQFLLGFYEKGVDEAELTNNSGNQQSGMFWSLSLYNYGSYMGPDAIYGSAPGLSYGPGWNGAQSSRYQTNQELQDNHVNGYSNLWRVGINNQGYLYVAYYDAGRTNDYVLVARQSSVLDGTKDVGFACKLINGNATLVNVPVRTATDPSGPQLAYRYIESPDGSFYYPLFATEEEAKYVDVQNGGADPGSAHAHAFVDEPTGTTWYMPDNGGTHAGASAPTNSGAIVYTEIPTEDDGLHVPPVFNNISSVVAPEGTAVNINLYTSGDYVTSLNPANPFGLVVNNGYLQGNLPYVSADESNTVEVIRTNAFGSSTGQLVITAEDRPETSTITGWTVHQGNIMPNNVVHKDENAVLSYNTPLSRGTRVRIPFEAYMKFGFATTAGEAIRETGDLFAHADRFTNWDLLFTVWGTGVVNHNNNSGVGWDFNGAITQYGHESTDVYLLDYRDDGHVWLTNEGSGEVLLQSSTVFSGDLTLYTGTPEPYSLNTTIPAITVEDLEFTGSAIQGFTNNGDGEALIDASTMGDGTVVVLDTAVENNHRLVIRKEWIENNIMAGLNAATGTSQFLIGIPADNANWTGLSAGGGNVAAEDFKLAVGFAMTDAIRGSSWKLKMYKDGVQIHNIGVGGTGTNAIYDIVFSNIDGRWEMSLQNNFGNPVPTDAALALRQINGGTWSQTVVHTGFSTGAETIYLGAQNTQANLSLTGIEHVREPFLAQDFIVGELNSGALRWAGPQPLASKFDLSNNAGHAAYSGDGIPTLAAGQTYRFIYHPSFEEGDFIELRLASDDTTVYSTGVTAFGSGDPNESSDYKGIEFAVPTNVPPLKIFYYNSNAGGSYNTLGTSLPISGSTYVEVNTAGADVVGPNANHTGDLVTGDYAWVELDMVLNAGERLIVPPAFHQSLAAAINASSNGGGYTIGLASPSNFDPEAARTGLEERNQYFNERRVTSFITSGGTWRTVLSYQNGYVAELDSAGTNYVDMNVALELTNSGKTHRLMIDGSSGHDPATTTYANWTSTRKMATQTFASAFNNVKVILKVAANANGDDIDLSTVDFTLITKQALPVPPPASLTSWTKALDFSGSPEYAKNVTQGYNNNVQMTGGVSAVVSKGNYGDDSYWETHYSNEGLSRPFLLSAVFNPDNQTEDAGIFGVCEGDTNSYHDSWYLGIDANNKVFYTVGRPAHGYNRAELFTATAGNWYGVYVDYSGARLSAPTETDLNHIFRFFIVDLTTQVATRITANWTNVGVTLAEGNAAGHTLIGKTGSPSGTTGHFKGKIAALVESTLVRDSYGSPGDAAFIDQTKLDATEIGMIVRDPMRWLQEYKVGKPFRRPGYSALSLNFQISGAQPPFATKVWLMGDGTNDAYATIRNQVSPSEQNYTVMNMVNLVANDIETINIPGLT